MMGERDSQKQLWSFQVNLDKRVRSDHLLRRINQARDLDFVQPEVARFYSTKGKTGSEARQHLIERSFADALRGPAKEN